MEQRLNGVLEQFPAQCGELPMDQSFDVLKSVKQPQSLKDREQWERFTFFRSGKRIWTDMRPNTALAKNQAPHAMEIAPFIKGKRQGGKGKDGKKGKGKDHKGKGACEVFEGTLRGRLQRRRREEVEKRRGREEEEKRKRRGREEEEKRKRRGREREERKRRGRKAEDEEEEKLRM
eukprot:s291_g34.t1